MRILTLDSESTMLRLDSFAQLLIETVESGGAVGFILPLEVERARAFWRNQVAPEVAAGNRILFAAFEGDQLLGTVQVILDHPANQPHRCDLAKMMVAPSARRRGIAGTMLKHALEIAREHGKTIMTLDTKTGDGAEALYRGFGFEAVGIHPDYALDPDQQNLHATTYMFTRL